jgi:hypothetical protein
MNRILHHTIYSPNPFGHGGEKRTAQLIEIFDEVHAERVELKLNDTKGKNSYFSFFKSFVTIISTYQIFRFKSVRIFLRFLKRLTLEYKIIREFFGTGDKLFVWESTKDMYYYLPRLAKDNNKRVVALPHNLESLVPDQKSYLTGELPPNGYSAEIHALKHCDAVFCISREETLLLKLFGVHAFYLPYYPTKEVEEYLLTIRRKRELRAVGKVKQILLMGSAINPPTRLGMESRIAFFNQNNPTNAELRVMGYGTDVLKDFIDESKCIKLLGELSIDDLETELLNADALLIHQPATSGALTRIVEMLLAGIPVLVNEDSARSYFGADGVLIYDNDGQLLDYLSQSNFKVPTLPEKPKFQVEQFKEKIREYTVR